jgi:tetratricopeptide (TPR) repeat protein
MMNQPLIAAAATAGLLMMACGGMRTSAPATNATTATNATIAARAAPEDAITALEQACLLDSTNAANWARLATALEADGQRERATRFYQQAATLSAHDARRDYALVGHARAGAVVRTAALPALNDGAEDDAYAGMPRTQVQKIGAAMVQIVRLPPAAVAVATLPAASAASAVSATSATSTAMAAAPAAPAPDAPVDAVRLEISNGNGVTGAAARLARTLDVQGVATVRLTNVKHFNVPLTRIEYAQVQQEMAHTLSQRLGVPLKVQREKSPRADLRIVLGHDAGTRLK